MGVLNMTPDSFSDGGKFNSLKKLKKIKNDKCWSRYY
jgi:dihydropteroate synthase